MLEDYVAGDTDSPIQSLKEFDGHTSSCSNLSVVSTSEPLCIYHVEKPVPASHIRCTSNLKLSFPNKSQKATIYRLEVGNHFAKCLMACILKTAYLL